MQFWQLSINVVSRALMLYQLQHNMKIKYFGSPLVNRMCLRCCRSSSWALKTPFCKHVYVTCLSSLSSRAVWAISISLFHHHFYSQGLSQGWVESTGEFAIQSEGKLIDGGICADFQRTSSMNPRKVSSSVWSNYTLKWTKYSTSQKYQLYKIRCL